jgi:hypothetical protein
MAIEDDIYSYLAEGYTPQQIIHQFHFKKSTVYKVYNERKLVISPVAPPPWSAEDISFDRGLDGRYLPGDTATVHFKLVNQSPSDLYVVRAGIQPEWLQGQLGQSQSEWQAQEGTFLLRPDRRKAFTFRVEVPGDILLGEYDLRFGIEGQFLSPLTTASSYRNSLSYYPEWSEPVVFRVQYPVTHTVFVSHSTANMSLVRQLDCSLENYGIHCIIAEDIKEPGRDLHEKFYHYIDTSSFFLGLLTREAVMSQTALDEVNYALATNKPGIYLVEDGAGIQLPVEWASKFSRYWPIDQFAAVVLEAIENIQQRVISSHQRNFPTGAVAAALAAFFVGLGIGIAKSDKGFKR